MIRRRKRLSAAEARRTALAAQGFGSERPGTRPDRRHFRRVLQALGVMQLDFVNVLVPAHFLMVWSRLGAYDRGRFEHFLYESGEYTEQWAHEASVVPVAHWPALGFRRRRYEQFHDSPLHRIPGKEDYLTRILEQVRSEGPVTSADLPPVPGPRRKPGDWHRSVPRWALEYHFGRGKLAVRRRLANFQRVYDLPERLIARPILDRHVRADEAHRELLGIAADRLGIATLQDLADFYRLSPRDTAPRVAELVEDGVLTPVAVDGWTERAYLAANAKIPRAIDGACLLSPFDPTVWFRPRAERLFGFEYRIEIYVPAARRRWGYYVLPFRLGDRIVARVDLKADRQTRRLLIRRAHLEPGADGAETTDALRHELAALSKWLELGAVVAQARDVFTQSLAPRET